MGLYEDLCYKWTEKTLKRINPPNDRKDEMVFNSRREITKDYLMGSTLPEILDKYSKLYSFKQVDGDPHRGVIVFRDSKEDSDLVHRNIDGTTLYFDNVSREAIAISYDYDYLEEDVTEHFKRGNTI